MERIGSPEGNNFNRYENESGISKLDRLRLMEEIAVSYAEIVHEMATRKINSDPLLQALLGKIVESGPELDPTYLAHLRKIVALRMSGLPEIAEQIALDREFYAIILEITENEIVQLNALIEEKHPSDAWDIALEDLSHLEGGDDLKT
jgi:DNA-binding phage protein